MGRRRGGGGDGKRSDGTRAGQDAAGELTWVGRGTGRLGERSAAVEVRSKEGASRATGRTRASSGGREGRAGADRRAAAGSSSRPTTRRNGRLLAKTPVQDGSQDRGAPVYLNDALADGQTARRRGGAREGSQPRGRAAARLARGSRAVGRRWSGQEHWYHSAEARERGQTEGGERGCARSQGGGVSAATRRNSRGAEGGRAGARTSRLIASSSSCRRRTGSCACGPSRASRTGNGSRSGACARATLRRRRAGS